MAFFLPIAIAVALWWLSTVIALYRIGLPSSSYRKTFMLVSVIGAIGIVLFIASAATQTVFAAYASFAAALGIWSWHEVSYYLGFVSGPVPEACPPGVSRAQRFVRGVRASLHHELAIILTAVILMVLTFGAPNQVGLWTFCILWLMRWSAKLNIFLGVRNVHMEFLPQHLRYLATFMARRKMNPLFPLSLLLAGVVLARVIGNGLTPEATPFELTSSMLLATLLALAVLEHVLLMLKVPDAVLWRLGTASRRAGSA